MNSRTDFEHPFYLNKVLIDPRRSVVEDNGERRKISPRAMGILKCLIKNANRIVTYEELADDVWGEPTDESVVYQQLGILRKALGDDPNNPGFIKTLPRVGYQLIAELYFSDEIRNEPVLAKLKKSIYGKFAAAFAIVPVAAVFVWYIAAHMNGPSERELLLDASSYLRYPEYIVAIQSSKSTGPDSGIIKSMELLIEHHLDQNPELHVTYVPKLHDRPELMPRIRQHFGKHGILEYVFDPVLVGADGNITQMLLHVQEPVAGTVVYKVAVPIEPSAEAISSALVEFEKQLLVALENLKLVNPPQQLFLTQDIDSNLAMVDAARILPKLDIDVVELEEMQQAIEYSHRALRRNPANLTIYSILWQLALSMILSSNEFDIAALLDSMKPHVDNLLDLYPDYYKSPYIASKYYYWTQEPVKAAQLLSDAIKKKPFDVGVLIGLSWNLGRLGETVLRVHEINHDINPFHEYTAYYYRDALLSANHAGRAVQVLDYFAGWDLQPHNWRLESQISTRQAKLLEFSAWYRSRFAGIDDDPAQAVHARQSDRSSVPSRYIGYMLLNAGRPELARFWQRHGREDQLAFFDLRIIELLADIWQGQWQPEKWRVQSELAEERRAFQNTTDKLNIFYFDYYAGLYQHATDSLLAIFPEFAQAEFEITRDNFRYAVYYSEMRKRVGDYDTPRQINKMAKQFLAEIGEMPDRNVDFGIADVEFHALLGDQRKALSLLDQAIRQQGWLPNAFWRWPPIETNISLKSLRGLPQFEEMARRVRQQMQALCFEETCSNGA